MYGTDITVVKYKYNKICICVASMFDEYPKKDECTRKASRGQVFMLEEDVVSEFRA